MPLKLRDFTKYVLVIAAFVVAGFLFWKLRSQLGLIAMAAFIAVVLNPITDWLMPKMPRRSRLLASLATYAIVLGVALVLLAIVITPLLGQVGQLANDLPQSTQNSGWAEQIKQLLQQAKFGPISISKQTIMQALSAASGSILNIVQQITSSLVNLGMMIGLSFFFLLEGSKIADFLKAILYPRTRNYYAKIADHTTSVVARYIGGNFLISAIAGAATLLFLLLVKAPFAFVLAIIVAVCDLIPLVGAGIGAAIVSLILAILAPQLVLPTLLYIIVYQQIENNVLAPVIYKKMVYISPLLSFIAVIIGSALAGILGALIAVPLVGVAQIVVEELLDTNLPHYKKRSSVSSKQPNRAKSKPKTT